MRLLNIRAAAPLLALVLLASSCGGGNTPRPYREFTGTTTSAPPTTSRPEVTAESSPSDTDTAESSPSDPDTTERTEPDTTESPQSDATDSDSPTTTSLAGTGTEPPPPPRGLACLPSVNNGEALVEWDAPEDTTNISKVRLYVSVDGGPFKTNRTYSLDQVDTNRTNGTKWAAAITRLPVNTPFRIAATTFNALNAESGWHIIEAVYTGPGESCGPDAVAAFATTSTLPPTTNTVG